MTQHPRLSEILSLPAEERLALVAAIWDSLAAPPGAVPMPDFHRDLVSERLDEDDADQGPLESWADIRRRIEGAA